MLLLKFGSPPYAAVRLCVPGVRAEAWKAALPLASVPVPSVVVPSRNVTVPVGEPDEELTVAVRVTACPISDGFADDVTAVLLADLLANFVGVVLDPPPPQAA